MRTLSYTELPRTSDPRQVFTLDVMIDGSPFHARIELPGFRRGGSRPKCRRDHLLCRRSRDSLPGAGLRQHAGTADRPGRDCRGMHQVYCVAKNRLRGAGKGWEPEMP